MTEPSGGSSDKPRRPVVVPVIALTALTAVGVTALLGGLGEAPDELDTLGAGAVLDQGQYDTKFVETRVTVVPPESEFQDEKRFLEMVFDVTNKGDETADVGLPAPKPEQAYLSAGFGASLLKITPAFGKDAGPFVFAQAKGGETRQLQPGVPARVIVRYQLQENQPPPEKVSFEVAGFEFSPDFNSDIPRWQMITSEVGDKFLPEVKARVTMTVKKGAAT
ncbi:hypothetical protein [Nonomuraea jiangxiensis]|uniref:Uncharacterized protein n=1 Tax=Nonomuraea jiangxiensis TaxID=633440 RepID=A0A1G8LB37_9ACTN|nr:hypothetical protein [Nonomuraea jiangxiensis]SDI52892.1 hypothetical protein SAMN05421869_10646 [Nonomuraea jiangxiensis]